MEDPLHKQFIDSCVEILTIIFKEGIKSVSFEKDNPLHIKFIHSTSNLFSKIFKIPYHSVEEVHRLAGEIMPASLITTAIAVGLIGLEYYKIVQRESSLVPKFKRSYVVTSSDILTQNALKMLSLSTPEWVTIDLHKDLTVAILFKVLKEKFFTQVIRLYYHAPSSTQPVILLITDSGTISEIVKTKTRIIEFPDHMHYFMLEACYPVGASEDSLFIKYRFK